MSNITPWTARSTSAAVPEGFTRAEAKELQRATNREVAAGILINTRLSVANFVANTALDHTANLVQRAYALADGDPYLASLLGPLVIGYHRVALDEIDSLRRLR